MTLPGLAERVAEVRGRIDAAVASGGLGQRVTIVAVTKTHGPEAVEAAWQCGLHDIGENKVQEAIQKMESVKAPVRWHMIGHLQSNKVKTLDRFVMLHSVDRSRLANAVSEFGLQRGRPVDVLMQVNASWEDTKGGFGIDDVRAEAERMAALSGIRVRGVMTMARFGAEELELRATFAQARKAREYLLEAGHPAEELSMGMSQDYEIAVEEGATMVRLGTTLFGAREP